MRTKWEQWVNAITYHTIGTPCMVLLFLFSFSLVKIKNCILRCDFISSLAQVWWWYETSNSLITLFLLTNLKLEKFHYLREKEEKEKRGKTKLFSFFEVLPYSWISLSLYFFFFAQCNMWTLSDIRLGN